MLKVLSSYIDPKCLYKDMIIKGLEYGRTYDISVLDTLYSNKVITLEEYRKYVNNLIDKSKWDIELYQKVLESTKDEENFDPSILYCCCCNYAI